MIIVSHCFRFVCHFAHLAEIPTQIYVRNGCSSVASCCLADPTVFALVAGDAQLQPDALCVHTNNNKKSVHSLNSELRRTKKKFAHTERNGIRIFLARFMHVNENSIALCVCVSIKVIVLTLDRSGCGVVLIVVVCRLSFVVVAAVVVFGARFSNVDTLLFNGKSLACASYHSVVNYSV